MLNNVSRFVTMTSNMSEYGARYYSSGNCTPTAATAPTRSLPLSRLIQGLKGISDSASWATLPPREVFGGGVQADDDGGQGPLQEGIELLFSRSGDILW